MRNWIGIVFLLFIYSCEKDKVVFQYNSLDPNAGEKLLFLDSVKVISSGSNNYVIGYYHFDREKLFFPEGIAKIGHYRNGSLIHAIAFPAVSNITFYDYQQLPGGSYTYDLRFINPDDEASIASNSIVVIRP